MTQKEGEESTVTEGDSGGGNRAPLTPPQGSEVVQSEDIRLHADVEKMTACPMNDTLFIVSIDSESKSIPMTDPRA